MRRFFKWAVIVFLTLLFVVAAGLGTAYYYKPEILAAINEKLKSSFNGDAHLRDITFSLWDESPGLSITLHDLYLRGPQYEKYSQDFLNAKKVYVSVRLLPLLKKTLAVRSIRVSHGEIFAFRSKTGYTNLDVFKKPAVTPDTATVKDPMLILFSNVFLEDVKVSYQDSLKDKAIGFHLIDIKMQIIQKDSSNHYTIEGPVKFEGLMLNKRKGSFLKDRPASIKWNLEYLPPIQQLVVHPSSLAFEKSVVGLTGNFDFGPSGNFDLKFESDKLDYSEGISLLTEALQSKLNKFNVDKPIKIITILNGLLNSKEDPAIDIAFDIKESHVMVHALELKNVTAEGAFTNHADPDRPHQDENSVVTIKRFDGIFRNFPAQVSATFTDLIDTRVELKANTTVDLKKFNGYEDSTRLKFVGGVFQSQIDFTGKLNELTDSTITDYKGKLKGQVQIKEGVFKYFPKNHNYDHVNVSLNFDQHHMAINDISFNINKNALKISGEMEGFIPFFVQPKKRGVVKLKVYSPGLDLSSILAKSPEPAKAANTTDKKKKQSLIDLLYEKMELSLSVQLDKVSFQNLRGFNVKGDVTLLNNNLEAKNFKMNLADGDITFNFTLANLQNAMNPIYVRSNIRHADIKKFFYSFNNFKLTSITWENLDGKLDANAWFQARVDDDFNIFMPGMSADVDFSIKNGRLHNFEPLQNMSNFLFKRRDFSDVQFGEIKSHLSVRGSEIDISRMEIESSVLRLFIEGRYSLKNNTDLEVQVPLSNLKRRDKDYKPENVGVDTKVGPSVFLHVTEDEQGKTVIAYDPFKKHVKKTTAKKK